MTECKNAGCLNLDSAGVSEADVKKRLLSMFEAHEYVLVTNIMRRGEKEGEREGGCYGTPELFRFSEAHILMDIVCG